MKYLLCSLIGLFTLSSCGDDAVEAGPQLVFKFKFDPEQPRLDNFGQPSVIPDGHAAQTSAFNAISANYIELAQNENTRLGLGEIVCEGPETMRGGALAIDFDQSIIVDEGEVFLSVPLSDVKMGTYEWLRVSLAYQNYEILLDARVGNTNFTDVPATAASFVGYNTYITDYQVKDQTITVNGNKLQGYVGIETDFTLEEFQAPPGATTVPNPLFNTSPIPPGSCVVTGEFDQDLVITGDETRDITIDMSVSINNSFEWEDDNGNGRYEPLLNEDVVDMGIRGLMPIITY
jgi:hypothetical protein